MDWREDKVLLDGLNGSNWTITTRLWSRLLQVRALPPEQVKVDVDRTLRRRAAADPPGAGHDPRRPPPVPGDGRAAARAIAAAHRVRHRRARSSRYFAEDAYELAAEPKELHVVRNAGHVDLYDKTDLIPFDKLEEFFTKNLA